MKDKIKKANIYLTEIQERENVEKATFLEVIIKKDFLKDLYPQFENYIEVLER